MSEQPAAPADPPPPREGIGERVEGWFRHDAPALSADLAALVRSHSPAVLRVTADLIEKAEGNPELRPLLADLLRVAVSAAEMTVTAL